MTADPTGFDRLRDEALAAVAAAGDLEALKTVRLAHAEEAATGPSWNAVALRSALVAMTVERDDLRAAHERLDRDGRAVAGRCLHYEARAKKAEAAIARVRALCDDAEIAVDQGRAQGHVCGPDCHCDCLAVEDVRAAADTTRPLDGEGDDQ